MSIILDIGIVLLIVICAVSSYRKGIVRCVLELIGLAASVIVSSLLAPALSRVLISKSVYDNVIKIASDIFTGSHSSAQTQTAMSLFGGVHPPSLTDALADGELADHIMDLLAGRVSYLVSFVLIFIGMSIITKIVIYAIDLAFHLPVIGTVNHMAGGLLGTLEGMVFAYALCVAISVITFLTLNTPEFPITPQTIDDSYIFKFLYANNLLARFL